MRPAGKGLTGTKLGCGEGGCGACTVVISSGLGGVKAVNACLYPVYSVVGCEVKTVEGVGDIRKGLHPVQVWRTPLNRLQLQLQEKQ